MEDDLSHLLASQFDVFGFDVELLTSKQQDIDIIVAI